MPVQSMREHEDFSLDEMKKEFNLTKQERENIARVFKLVDIKGGHWSIRHLEAMQAFIGYEIRRRYGPYADSPKRHILL